MKGMNGARFFQWLQSADFYRALHAEAVGRVPATGGRWLDVGCGPGLLTRLAAARGFEAIGVDASAAMVESARANGRSAAAVTAGRSHTPGARFEQASLDDLVASGVSARVVSAASLLLVLPDARAGLEALWQLIEPGGHLLVIETMPALTFTGALHHARGFSDVGLVLWGLARNGRSVAPLLDAFTPPDLASAARHPLCAGLVGAWSFTRRSPQESHP